MAVPAREVVEESLDVAGVETFVRRVDGPGVPTLFVHGNPSHSGDWLPFLERHQGPALAPDIPGWGRSERPPAERFDYSMHGQAGFLERFLGAAGIDGYRLVLHDWGALALIAAQAHPGRVRRLVVINAVPMLPGYRWHWIARWFWRRRWLGELANATATKAALRLTSRQASSLPGGLPDRFIESLWSEWPRGTWPEALALYRSAPEDALAAAGARLGSITAPALVVWGSEDPYLPVRFGRLYAERLPNAGLLALDRAGHWPWIDRPDAVDRILAFLGN